MIGTSEQPKDAADTASDNTFECPLRKSGADWARWIFGSQRVRMDVHGRYRLIMFGQGHHEMAN